MKPGWGPGRDDRNEGCSDAAKGRQVASSLLYQACDWTRDQQMLAGLRASCAHLGPPCRSRDQLRHDDDRAPENADPGGRLDRVEADNRPELHSFAAGISQDLAAGTTRLTPPCGSGSTEGNVNCLKAIEKQMCAASFELMRKRVLDHPT